MPPAAGGGLAAAAAAAAAAASAAASRHREHQLSLQHPDAPSALAILTDTGTVGIVTLATAIVIYASKNAVAGPPPFGGPKDEQEAPVTLTARKAAIFPVVGSLMLLLLYLFFDKIEFLYLLFNAFIAGICLEMAVRTPVSYVIGPPVPKGLYIPCFGLVQTVTVVSSAIAFTVVFMWLLSDHWVLLDVLGAGLCTFMLAAVRLPNLKIAVYLFVGLLVYDVFWVFFSSRMFETNVMVNVATKHGRNPMQSIASTLSLPMARGLPELSIPAKIMFPSSQDGGDYSMLGLGDIVLPGILAAHNLRYDAAAGDGRGGRGAFFNAAVVGYVVGLVAAILCSETWGSAQPALIYLLPATLGPTVLLAASRGVLGDMWSGATLGADAAVADSAELRHVI